MMNELPTRPQAVLDWLASRWIKSGWNAPDREHTYLRAPDDPGWQARMGAMRALVMAGEDAIAPLTAKLKKGGPSMRIFAAQTLGYFGPLAPAGALRSAMSPRVYAASGSLGSAARRWVMASSYLAKPARAMPMIKNRTMP